MSALIFLSHIHEERYLAQTIQYAIESEFGGFVEVFVSSDGKTIAPGANFLKRIEEGLISCVGAIYLISPVSVKRNWINFELGAIWIRSVQSVNNNGPLIPTIPFCHSGITPNQLPMPLVNLNAIMANNSAQLENAFHGIQSAVGGRGKLKTDFDVLAQKILSFENQYTVGDNLVALFKELIGIKDDIISLINHCKSISGELIIPFEFKEVDSTKIPRIKEIENNGLNGIVRIETKNPRTLFGESSMGNFYDVEVYINTKFIIEHEQILLKHYH